MSKTNAPIAVIYDARGNGNGGVCPTLTGDHQNRITDYTAIVVERTDENIHGEPVRRVPRNGSSE